MNDGDEASGERLSHLSGRGAGARQAIAAHFLRPCRDIVEIGGAGLPITGFITHAPASVTVIDPKIAPFESETLAGRPCRVRHLAMKFQAASIDSGGGPLGVALIGLSLKPLGRRAVVDDGLVALLRRAAVVIIEHSLTLDRAIVQVPALIAAARLETDVTIDMRIVDGAIDAAGHGERRLMVLRPA